MRKPVAVFVQHFSASVPVRKYSWKTYDKLQQNVVSFLMIIWYFK